MSTEKKERVMSAKGFLHKSGTKAAKSAAAFIAAHRAWLETGELASLTSPILAKLDSNELLPTPALTSIRAVVLGHMLAVESEKAERQVDKLNAPAIPKNWVATVYNAKGEIEIKLDDEGNPKDLTKGFELGQEADRWADRRLVECASDCYAEIVSEKHNVKHRITRDEAFERVFPGKKSPVMKSKPKSTPRLGFGVKASQDHCHFSRG